MPANLTPDYEKAERRYKEAVDDAARLDALREMLSVIPKHKGTEKLQADIKRKLSQLRRSESRKPVRGADPYHVPHSGAGQVVLVGVPNVGKSMIVATATHAQVKVAEYPFTTQLPAPGMLHFEDVQIQLVDTPPVTAEHVPTGLLGTIRASDIIAIVADMSGDALDQADTVCKLLADKGVTLRSVPIRSWTNPRRPSIAPSCWPTRWTWPRRATWTPFASFTPAGWRWSR